jgi:hypothetical protein
MINSKSLVAYSCILLSFILSACSAKTSTILEDKSCAPPCWHNITPGVSTKKEVLASLQKLNGVDQNSIQDVEATWGNFSPKVYWKFTNKSRDIEGNIYFQNDFVTLIEIRPKRGALNLDNALQKLGEPEQILAIADSMEGVGWLNTYIFYPDKGVILFEHVRPFINDDPAVIEGNHQVMSVFYIDPNKFYDVMVTNQSLKLDPETIQKGIQPWKGYGEIVYIDNRGE